MGGAGGVQGKKEADYGQGRGGGPFLCMRGA